jgi:carbamate kinase
VSSSALIAVGGNSLIRAGEKGTIGEQIDNARRVSRGIVRLLSDGMRLVITHGNGPQVGAALLRSERAAGQVYEQSLDVCGAATQGEIGYILQQALQQELQLAGMQEPVATVLTRVVVSAQDPAFRQPTKPIGPFYSRSAAEEKARVVGWQMVEDSYRGYRRVVASPQPLEIVEEEVIRRMLQQGILIIAVGGGGIPVIREQGSLRGIEAVIDKDRASSLLASRLPVERLIITTEADHVYVDFKKPGQKALRTISACELQAYNAAGQFPPGSMGPKVQAALRFLDNGGKEAIITSDELLVEAVRGGAGTHVFADSVNGGLG